MSECSCLHDRILCDCCCCFLFCMYFRQVYFGVKAKYVWVCVYVTCLMTDTPFWKNEIGKVRKSADLLSIRLWFPALQCNRVSCCLQCFLYFPSFLRRLSVGLFFSPLYQSQQISESDVCIWWVSKTWSSCVCLHVIAADVIARLQFSMFSANCSKTFSSFQYCSILALLTALLTVAVDQTAVNCRWCVCALNSSPSNCTSCQWTLFSSLFPPKSAMFDEYEC